MNPYRIVIQNAYQHRLPFTHTQLKSWALLPLQQHCQTADLTIRLVCNDEIQVLNTTYRQQAKPTNVLAFPSDIPAHIPQRRRALGDLVLAPDILKIEHELFFHSLETHWAYVIIHGILHLLGYTHEASEDTAQMQQQEALLLAKLNYPHPHHPLESTHLE